MKKVIIFLLTAAIAIGAIGFVHASVTDSQDELTIFPVVEAGDVSVLDGRTANLTLTCGDHLRWNADYTFGAKTTEATFEFNPEGRTQESGTFARMEVYCSGGVGASTSGGSFTPGLSQYGALLRAVAVITPDGGRETMNLKLADYVEYYQLDFELRYEDDSKACNEQKSLSSLLTGDSWYGESPCYNKFFKAFRFPVRDTDIMSATVGKDEQGSIVEIELHPENAPQIRFVSDVTAEGAWFLPIFQDEDGKPLSYESPEGHGIYFIPWKVTGALQYYGGLTQDIVTLDVDNLRLVQPVDETLQVMDMVIDAAQNRAWMLTLEDGSYVMRSYDLAAGTEPQRTVLLPHDGESEYQYAGFVRDDGFLLVYAQNQLALCEESTDRLLLTAPVDREHQYDPAWYDPADGELEFDGEHLTIIEAAYHRDNAFFILVFAQDKEVYYGEYDCTLLRGNDDWYYSTILCDQEPATLK